MSKMILLSGLAVMGLAAANASTFDITVKVQGASANGDAKSIEKIDLNASYLAYDLNTANKVPITIKFGDETVESIAPGDSRLLANEDDWGDVESYMINLSQKINRVGTYSIDVPEGFFKSNSNINAAAHQVINLISPMPSTLEISGDGIANGPVAMTLEGTVFSASVDVAGTGSFKLVGDDTYYGAASSSTALQPGVATPVGYQGKNFSIANGKYTVVVNWSDGNPTVTVKPKPETFDLEVSVQGASAAGVANMFQRINFNAPYVAYWLNSANTLPIEIKRGEEVILAINPKDSQLISVDLDDDWEDDSYMLSLSQKVNRVGTYTITVPEGFFKNSSKVNASSSKDIEIVSARPSELALRGDLKGSTCELTFNGLDTFSATAVEIVGDGKVDLMGSTWYGVADGVVEIEQGKPAPIGYQGGKWTVTPGVYDVKVVWNDDPMITFSPGLSLGVDEIDVLSEDTEYFNLQGLSVDNPEHGQIIIRKSKGKVSKIMY